jgi:hypothetical protein
LERFLAKLSFLSLVLVPGFLGGGIAVDDSFAAFLGSSPFLGVSSVGFFRVSGFCGELKRIDLN